MRVAYVAWAISAAVMFLLAIALGSASGRGFFGILIDNRGRYSLTQLQITLWSVVIIPLISGVFWARLLANVPGALEFQIPDQLLIVLGISVGSTALATAAKSQKDANRPEAIASSEQPRLSQIFLLEEGAMADRAIDVTKYQNFLITIVLLVAYVALAIDSIRQAQSPEGLTALPGFGATFVTLLGISHAGYLAGKLPDRAGTPGGRSLAARNAQMAASRT